MRLRLLIAGSLIVMLGACGADDGSGTPPTINATLPPGASIEAPTRPPETDAGAAPEETQAPEQPEETQAPEQPEETQPPEETAPPEEQIEETAAPDTTPTSSVDAEDDDGDGTLWWPWVLGALVVIGAVVALTRRRRPGGPSWPLRTTTLLDDVEQLTTHLAAVTPGGLQAVAQVDATRLATMRATLRDLIESAPDANSQTALSALTTPIAQLHGAIDAVAMSADPSIQTAGASVTQLATQLHTASASVRAYLAVHG